MKNHHFVKFITTLICCMGLISCDKSFDFSYFSDNTIVDPEFDLNIKGIPLGYVEYKAGDLFEKLSENLETGKTNDGITTFVFRDTLDTSDNDEAYVKIDDITVPTDFVIYPFSSFLTNESLTDHTYKEVKNNPLDQAIQDAIDTRLNDLFPVTSDNIPIQQSFPVDNALLRSALFKTGVFEIEFISNVNLTSKITLNIPSVRHKITKEPFQTTVTLTGNLDPIEQKETFTVSVPLEDYYFDFTYSIDPNDNTKYVGNVTENNIVLDISTEFSISAGDQLNSNDYITYAASLKNLIPQLVIGDITGKTFDIKSSDLNFDLFDSDLGKIEFADPRLSFEIVNPQGIPLTIDLSGIKASNSTTANEIALTITDQTDFPNGKLQVKSGNLDVNNNFAITPETTVKKITKDNSNIPDLMSPTLAADKISFNVTNEINEPGFVETNSVYNSENGQINNFFNPDYQTEVYMGIEIPLEVTLNNVKFSPDAFEFDTSDIQENATSLGLRIASRNSIPLDGIVTLTFARKIGVDVNNKPILETVKINNATDFIKTITAIKAAPVNANGMSIYAFNENGKLYNIETNALVADYVAMDPNDSSKFALEFNNTEIEALKDVTHVQAEINFISYDNTSNIGAVKIQDSDKVRISLALTGDIKVSK